MNNIFEIGDFPSIWKSAIVIPFPKPGKDHSEPSNYRAIYSTNQYYQSHLLRKGQKKKKEQ